MATDVEIAQQFTPKPITEVTKMLNISADDVNPYGRDIAKIALKALSKPQTRKGRLILVSATTPTPSGEGKTTTTIGLGQAFTQLNESVCLALREPSLGPCLGMKGGATGGGYSQIMPADRINLHFTGDFHAITSANNLLSAAIDNHIYQGNDLSIDPRQIVWRRVMDMNDRSLRKIVLGLGGKMQGIPREGGFDITAASEVMAMLCLACDAKDLKQRLDRTLIGYTYDGEPIVAKQLKITGAMMALLRDALEPNLVQSFEGTPAFVHGGPFANIAHGCNSIIATKMAMHHADWAITEAGFGFDLGAEKFFDIKCRIADIDPDVVVLVTTVRALKMHGGNHQDNLVAQDLEAVRRGLANLDKHIESVALFNKHAVVALNRFTTDTDAEINLIRQRCIELGVSFAETRHHAEGGKGAIELAKVVMAAVDKSKAFIPLYQLEESVLEKVRVVSRAMYGADDVAFSKQAAKDLKNVEQLGLTHLPICIAKAPSSLSDDPLLHGRPRDFEVTVSSIQINAGAGFLVILTGNIMRMPGLPKHPSANNIELLDNGVITGLE
ncbi:formate--tetrahydrofolate ligase [Colwellia sp. M166]|uniref:formate--tetrahydrofolate ligase n=1 Tax=Colwellia sp. M166 TaxID=2583805 RepID=UPI00211E472C|nr:formate--tetrahydrofolate ligase [Colwellia sp. M166]UUO25405.1 formate--tetrahydrofolate ligase [Colwellia sp. M166]|tara:strand:- start:1404 stop:3068 length:1665 start_codon:yes stop_codon:yes gene_type:complete